MTARAKKNNRSIQAEYLATLNHGVQSQSLEMVVAQALNRMVPFPVGNIGIGIGNTGIAPR